MSVGGECFFYGQKKVNYKPANSAVFSEGDNKILNFVAGAESAGASTAGWVGVGVGVVGVEAAEQPDHESQ